MVAKAAGQRVVSNVEQGAQVRRAIATAHHLKGRDVGHPAGDPGLDRAIEDDLVVRPQPAEAAIGMDVRLPDC